MALARGRGRAFASTPVTTRRGRARARVRASAARDVSPDRVAASATGAKTGKRVFRFGAGAADGARDAKGSLGGKGANLAEMSRVGLSVPPGFTVTTETCADYHENGSELPPGAWEEMVEGLGHIEQALDKKLGDAENPLLVSVRSGAAVSMPGMMDTVLNLGLNDACVEGLAKKAGGRFAFDSYRRFLDMYGNVVMGVDHHKFENALERMKKDVGAKSDEDLTEANLRDLVEIYKGVYASEGVAFPQDPYEQLKLATFAVFDSWNSDRAKKYMSINKITGLRGTAVNIQAMVFGNMGETSGTGVLFTRNPSTGENKLYGEYLVNAQGEDVVAGIRTPSDISTMAEALPQAYDQLVKNCELLESHYKDMQDIEFTVQEGTLYMLQCRSGKRTGAGAVKIAVDLVKDGFVTEEEAVQMVEPTHVDQLLHPQFKDEKAYKPDVIGSGLPASPGASVGQIVFTTEDAEVAKAEGRKVILVRVETSPEDVGGMDAAEGILTARGGMTSHAAVVARGWGKTCVSGCTDLTVDERGKTLTLGGVTLVENDWLSLNGTTGEIIRGRAELAPPSVTEDLGLFMSWVDKFRTMKVFTNADTPEDAAAARANGAEGIGLVRTEHMFFGSGERIRAVRRMIMAKDTPSRETALDELLPYQREDFKGIFVAMSGLPVTIRLLDPPLHEFLPDGELDDVISLLSEDTGEDEDSIVDRIEKLAEVNPMLGFRGCRLAITYPEIARMQVRAIFEAAIEAEKEGSTAIPDIMVPLVGTVAELEDQVALIRQTASVVFAEQGKTIDYRVGTMIEIPRAALLADQIAAHAEFFSFGTNDLTQMTFGYSRDDVGKFLPTYLEKGILKHDPFQVIDRDGVGQLIKMSVKNGRSARSDLKVGICGEHGGEPMSVEFFAQSGLDYVSCSPFRVPIARLSAAQAAIRAKKDVSPP
ncbi:Pyruvate, phosphate dikinase [Ostreococcus tauri]|uniref:Pyruvate, phosphate dikinase n=1 Tax=Ostreococcus tauri TaxID=70448 RepID=Q01DP8_OSTTA|nr:Pyruvate, phosphate dikinase [Ostreococcus tauri]OUS42283.1 chloroplast Pyruvate, phosphate dikinase [Ostreococcus tauri]CAL52555.1 Pyruvate, phosphate dikinase [Ostreococcus tauri]|eukprot:XP_003075283.1 Pyruvate, phosphate dikinase [Ostreococcus tauri]